ncbi:amidase [Mucilaginibacter sp. UR6-1]|uniref:SH3 domain-containing protein n=1 Tax=Mucilaginibacter sp. UR6-1 TaxID=1435643 RepID=UPI001E4F9E88|nr:SH3 domain-containing protein [Mucilaginibacter sp. UR6-1]MCC8410207.1 amidase [Mucilaginibacter sp. UR6-1]
MTTKFGFTKMDIQEFEAWIDSLKVARTVLTVQQHHTYSPSYQLFKGNNHFELQKGMQDYHINHNGWAAIGQHFTTFPDGAILTGRSLEKSPACITGQNANAICIENLGNFDTGKDSMTVEQRDTIVRITAKLCTRFSLPVNTNSIVYHHWFDLTSGQRNNGTKNNKSCPGTAFFGGNKVSDCENNFLPLVAVLTQPTPQITGQIIKYAMVTASSLNIRTRPDPSSAKANDRAAATLGAVLRVYEEKSGWYRISASQQHWVAAKFTAGVKHATVTANTLNVRTGPGTSFEKVGAYTKGQELFIVEQKNKWSRIGMDNKWVSNDFLAFD